MPQNPTLQTAVVTPRGGSLATNLAWNLAGESTPVLAAVFAIPTLLHHLGPDRFGVLTLSWMIAGYFGMFDFGLGRALTKAMAQEIGLGRNAKAATLLWTSLVTMFSLGALAGVVLALIAPWLTTRALRIPFALRDETLTGLYVIAIGLPMLISSSALRAALAAADRFDLLNLVRTPSGILGFVAPVLMLPFTHRLGWLIAALVLNRMLTWSCYAMAIGGALAELRRLPRLEVACLIPLLGFGAWITVSNVITPMMVYLDRFVIGATLSMAALTAYSVPMEIVSKSFVFPAAVSGVIFPAFARSFAVAPAVITALFERALKLVAFVLYPACAMVVAFAPQIMSVWIGPQYAAQSAVVLQILAVGAFVTGLSWIPLALLHGADRPDLAAKIHLVDFPLYALAMWIFVGRFGLAGAAFTWSGRLLIENLVLFAMTAPFIEVSRREVVGACAALIGAIVVIASGAFISDLWGKSIFIGGIFAMTAVAGWRVVLDETTRARIVGFIPSVLRPASGRLAN